jgi:hypothetical protein
VIENNNYIDFDNADDDRDKFFDDFVVRTTDKYNNLMGYELTVRGGCL